MKILIVVNYYYPYISGVSEYARYVAEALSKFHSVTVLTCQHSNDLLREENISENLTIIRSKPMLFLNKGYISPAFISDFSRLQKDHDVVNFHFPMLEVGLLAKMTDKKIWLTYQCDMDMVGRFFDRLAVKAVQFSGKLALNKSEKVIVLTKDYAENSKILSLVSSEKLVEISPPNRFESELNQICENTAYKKRIGFVGRFVEEKGIKLILEAADKLKNSDVEFVLAGDYENVAGGTITEQLVPKLKSLNNVTLLGRLDDNELREFYSGLDILLLPSVNSFEAFGMVQLEAMEFGSLVVASNLPGVRQVITKTGMGVICDVNSAESLINSINKAIEMRSIYSKHDVKNKMRNVYSSKTFENFYLNLVREL